MSAPPPAQAAPGVDWVRYLTLVFTYGKVLPRAFEVLDTYKSVPDVAALAEQTKMLRPWVGDYYRVFELLHRALCALPDDHRAPAILATFNAPSTQSVLAIAQFAANAKALALMQDFVTAITRLQVELKHLPLILQQLRKVLGPYLSLLSKQQQQNQMSAAAAANAPAASSSQQSQQSQQRSSTSASAASSLGKRAADESSAAESKRSQSASVRSQQSSAAASSDDLEGPRGEGHTSTQWQSVLRGYGVDMNAESATAAVVQSSNDPTAYGELEFAYPANLMALMQRTADTQTVTPQALSLMNLALRQFFTSLLEDLVKVSRARNDVDRQRYHVTRTFNPRESLRAIDEELLEAATRQREEEELATTGRTTSASLADEAARARARRLASVKFIPGTTVQIKPVAAKVLEASHRTIIALQPHHVSGIATDAMRYKLAHKNLRQHEYHTLFTREKELLKTVPKGETEAALDDETRDALKALRDKMSGLADTLGRMFPSKARDQMDDDGPSDDRAITLSDLLFWLERDPRFRGSPLLLRSYMLQR